MSPIEVIEKGEGSILGRCIVYNYKQFWQFQQCISLEVLGY